MGLKKFAVTPGFGVGGTVFHPDQLIKLGAVVGEEAKIELTTFKQLYIEMEEERLEEVMVQLKAIGLEIYPSGFFTKSLITCNFCKGAEEAGLKIAKELDDAIAGIEVPYPLRIGYSGCALATGEPLFKDIGIVKMRNTFDIFIGGEGKTLKATLAQLLVSNVPQDQLIPITLRLVTYFKENGKKKEKFSAFIHRVTLEKLKEFIQT
ncbi:nitrite reductase [Ammoniphilus sp. 3BR4]|uniref:nitrite reductase n=1 Tax=Ammoniphilus sp. 3BR4 TaxID=3158265 RepID=UPI0034677E8A